MVVCEIVGHDFFLPLSFYACIQISCKKEIERKRDKGIKELKTRQDGERIKKDLGKSKESINNP